MIQKKYNQGEWSLMSQRQRMSPFPNYMSMEAVCNEMEQFVGVTLKDVILFFQGTIMFAFNHTDTHHAAGRFIADRIAREPKLYANLIQEQKKFGADLIGFAKKGGKTALKPAVTNQELYNFFAGYDVRYRLVYASYGSVWTMEDELNADLYAIVQKRISDPIKASNILNSLTKQPLAMVATIERTALFKIAVAIAENKAWQEIIVSGQMERVKNDGGLNRLIGHHQKEFYWITRDYEDPILTYEKVVERLREMLTGDVAMEYGKLENDLAEQIRERKQYEKELQLTAPEKALFASMRDAANLKELRKRFVSESLYYFDPVLTEIGKRLYLSIKQVRFMRTADVKRALLNQENLEDELNQRMKLSVWQTGHGKETEVITGPEAEALFNQFCAVDKNATEFSGMAVSPGVARGPVKIVLNPSECDKVKKGDIIVSIQVVPSFSTAIIKSAGIICDGGHGITSHPATLAREANIPCVIQTRFAREILKDGDMVEVDGYKGTVKILKKV